MPSKGVSSENKTEYILLTPLSLSCSWKKEGKFSAKSGFFVRSVVRAVGDVGWMGSKKRACCSSDVSAIMLRHRVQTLWDRRRVFVSRSLSIATSNSGKPNVL
jgi:hypothetical protein